MKQIFNTATRTARSKRLQRNSGFALAPSECCKHNAMPIAHFIAHQKYTLDPHRLIPRFTGTRSSFFRPRTFIKPRITQRCVQDENVFKLCRREPKLFHQLPSHARFSFFPFIAPAPKANQLPRRIRLRQRPTLQHETPA